jgi:hypothetical protein
MSRSVRFYYPDSSCRRLEFKHNRGETATKESLLLFGGGEQGMEIARQSPEKFQQDSHLHSIRMPERRRNGRKGKF